MNLADHVTGWAKRSPDAVAIRFEGTSVTYATLELCATALADALARNGVRRGDRVALYLPNIPAFALAYLATLKAGAIAVSINAIFKTGEVEYIVNDCGAKVVFTTAELLPNVPRGNCPSVAHTVLCEGSVAGEIALEAWLAALPRAGRSRDSSADMRPDEPAAILYSSGTTGVPKGVVLTHHNIQSNIRVTVKCSGIERADRLATFLPLFHVFAQNYIMNGAFEVGATVVLFRRFVPDQVLAGIGSEQITMFFAVPTIYIAMLNMPLDRHDLSSLRYFFSAAATMPEAVARRWSDRFGKRIYEGYGLTECAPCAAYNHLIEHRFGSVGTAIEGFALRIVDENDDEVARGNWGEIAIRGPGVMREYWGKPAESAHTLRGGWLHSGDIGTMDAGGYVYIVDRVKDMINVSGFKVWPAEVENMLYRHPAIKEVAVYGVPHPAKGETVRVAVVLKEIGGATAASIIAYCREQLAVYKAPEQVDIVSELPKSATGKILKRVLRDQARP